MSRLHEEFIIPGSALERRRMNPLFRNRYGWFHCGPADALSSSSRCIAHRLNIHRVQISFGSFAPARSNRVITS